MTNLITRIFGKIDDNKIYDLAMQKLKENPENITKDPVYQKLITIEKYYSEKLVNPTVLFKTRKVARSFLNELNSMRMDKELYNSIYETSVEDLIRIIRK